MILGALAWHELGLLAEELTPEQAALSFEVPEHAILTPEQAAQTLVAISHECYNQASDVPSSDQGKAVCCWLLEQAQHSSPDAPDAQCLAGTESEHALSP